MSWLFLMNEFTAQFGLDPRTRRMEKSVAFNEKCLLIISRNCPTGSDDVYEELYLELNKKDIFLFQF